MQGTARALIEVHFGVSPRQWALRNCTSCGTDAW